jgi:ribosomal protein S18 acetylase RimI-like enzyme
MRADPDLYRRGIATLLASWEEYARAAAGAAVLRLPGVTAAVFPEGPERDVYNNAVLDRGLAPAALADAVGAMEAAYSAAGIERDGDCGIYNLGTKERARRRGVGTAVTAALVGRILEYAPPRPAG